MSQVPHPLPSEVREAPAPFEPGDRLVRKSDLDDVKKDLRREMRYVGIIGIAAGNVAAAIVAGYVTNAPAARDTVAALAAFVS